MHSRINPLKTQLLFGAALIALAPAIVHAETPVQVEDVIVTALRAPTPLSQVAAPVNLVSQKDFADRQAQGFAEVLERLPNVEFFGGPRLQGEMPSVRGATGRQVLISVDGARQNATPSLSTPLFLDPAFISRVEVLKGVGSSLYGAGALGGVLAFKTVSTDDLLAKDAVIGADARADYQSANGGKRLSARTYARSGGFDGLVGLALGEWGPVRQGGGTRLRPADGDSQTVIAKGGWNASDRVRAELSHIYYRLNDFQPNNPQADASFPYFQDNYAIQRQTVARLTGENAAGGEAFNLSVYRTTLNSGARENRAVTPVLTSTSTATRTTGFTGSGVLDFKTGPIGHRLVAGGDGYRDKIASRTDGQPGTVSPDGEQTSLGGFVRDEIALSSWLSVTPAARYDRYETKLASATTPKTSDTRVSPSLTASVRPASGALVYLSWGEAFRAPAVNELYQSLSQATAFANFRANPDLKPELSREWDLGASWSGKLPNGWGRLSLRGDAFKAKVDDLITSVVVGFYTNPFLGRRPIQQYQNVSKAKREGVEVEARLERGVVSAELGYSRIRVTDEMTGANLFSPPDKWTLGLNYAVSPDVSLRWRSSIVAAQDYDTTVIRRRPAYDVHDAFVSWAPAGRAWRVDLGVTNLFDEQYAAYKQSTAYPNVYEQGRSLRVGLAAKF
ncbi:TonB-dependent receptor domain-containing protein [Caulobacter segnis]|uniref:TonB-dependent receptor n=1 Tax=Caulobacter segnis TaxID=88688 RepID=A0A2W5V8R1_9CAUL|nr:TonB-dependent receptor [Caulobacter segnis]PZR36170.1 MAG: hypothetical protein DI526_04235 [Caulobacter segnis]